jgi:ribonucleoside-diphosphate reductase alpha chain
MFLDDTACNLASLNLMQFVKDESSRQSAIGNRQESPENPTADLRLPTAGFDIDSFEHAVRLWTVVLEISVMMAQFPSRRIAELSYEYRTLGLGYANIGGLLMSSGIPYDSKEGRALAGAITALMTGISYATSAEMAGELGAFPGYERNRKDMLRVIRNHRRAAYGNTEGYDGLHTAPVPLDAASSPDQALVEHARASWNRAVALGEIHGFRNAQDAALAAEIADAIGAGGNRPYLRRRGVGLRPDVEDVVGGDADDA